MSRFALIYRKRWAVRFTFFSFFRERTPQACLSGLLSERRLLASGFGEADTGRPRNVRKRIRDGIFPWFRSGFPFILQLISPHGLRLWSTGRFFRKIQFLLVQFLHIPLVGLLYKVEIVYFVFYPALCFHLTIHASVSTSPEGSHYFHIHISRFLNFYI